MKRTFAVFFLASCVIVTAWAQSQPGQPPKGQMPDLGRHTQQDDKVPPMPPGPPRLSVSPGTPGMNWFEA